MRTSSHSSYASSVTSRRATGRDADDDAGSVATTARLVEEIDIYDDEALTEIIMAVNVTDRGTVYVLPKMTAALSCPLANSLLLHSGCAYYDARNETLCFMEDVQLGGPDTVDACEYG